MAKFSINFVPVFSPRTAMRARISHELSAAEIVMILAFDLARSIRLPCTQRTLELAVRAHLETWGDQADYSTCEDSEVRAAEARVMELFPDWLA